MSKTCRKIPVVVNRSGRRKVVEVRRESNVELMQDSLNENGYILLRTMVQIKGNTSRFYGWQGVSLYYEAKTIQEARKFVSKLTQFVEGESNG